jgi:hypothetical protein
MISDFIIAAARYLLRTIPLPCKGITIRALYLRDMDISYTPISRLQAPGTVLLQYSLTTEDSAYLTCLIFPSRLTQARRSRSHGPSQMIKSIQTNPGQRHEKPSRHGFRRARQCTSKQLPRSTEPAPSTPVSYSTSATQSCTA